MPSMKAFSSRLSADATVFLNSSIDVKWVGNSHFIMSIPSDFKHWLWHAQATAVFPSCVMLKLISGFWVLKGLPFLSYSRLISSGGRFERFEIEILAAHFPAYNYILRIYYFFVADL